VCDVITVAKRSLNAGEVLDGIGGFTSYGMLENTPVSRAENLLPMGLSEGCRLKREVARDQAITFADVEMPKGRLCDSLWKEQELLFPCETRTERVVEPVQPACERRNTAVKTN
jgi:predicted homoserine dehydrogenase-like protein